MKKILSIALALTMLLALGVTAFAADKDPVADRTSFIMGIDPEYPPFSYLGDDGNYTGFDVEVCQAVCDLLGWKLEIFGVNWDEKLVQLDSMECDCVWSGMTILDSMKEAGYNISEPYYDNTQVLVVKADSGFASSADLAGKVVAVQLGTSGEALLGDEEGQLALAKTFEGGAPVPMENFTVCGTELAAGGVDAVVVDLPVAQNLAEKFGGMVILEETLGSEQYGICFRNGDDELCAKVQEGILKLVEDGTYLALAQKYGLDENVLCLLYNKAE